MLRPHGASVSLLQLSARQALGLLDVGLIEGVDTEALTQLPRRVLPPHEFSAQVEGVAREVGEG